MIFPSFRRASTLGLSAVIVFAGLLAPAAATAATTDDDALLADSFDRTASAGWGAPADGITYTASPPSAASVADGVGRFALTPGMHATATTTGVSATDATMSALLGVDAPVSAGNGVTFSLALRAENGFQYQARARFATGNRVVLWIARYDGGSGKETTVAKSAVAVTDLPVGGKVRLEFAVTGSSDIALKARAWLDGAAEPDWQVTGTDNSEARILRSGGAQVAAYLSSGSTAVGVSVDDVSIDAVEPGDSTPTPTPTTPTPTPTTPTPTPTTPTPTPPTPTPSTGDAGSAPVGTAAYSVPSGAIFVKPSSATGSGTLANPYGSAALAISKAPSGSTIVLRAGTYHESITVPKDKKLTIQAYPREAVWFDGASKVTGWSQSGSTWVVTGWNYEFDSRVSFTKGRDESHRFIDPAYPMAGYPDQVWVNGVALRQVASASQVTKGTFAVDKTGDRLIIGTDPTGATVEASTLSKAIQVWGKDSVLRGFGVKRYANTLSLMGAVSTEVPRITLENLVVTQNATAGIYAWAEGHVFRNLTVSDNGLMGLGANVATNLSVTDSVFSGNNSERFKWAPVSGGIKITKSQGVSITDNVFADNTTTGLWFDDSSYDIEVTGNVMRGNKTLGLLVEATDKVVIADNYLHDNGKGIVVFNAGNIEIWNNTLVGNTRTLEFMQDERRQVNSALASKIPWVMRNVTVKNNVLSYGSGGCPVLTQDLTKTWYGNDFGITLDGNLYHRASSSSPSNFSCWANGSAGLRSFKTFADFASHTRTDTASAAREGGSIVDSGYRLSAAALATPGLSARTLPSAISQSIGVDAGVKGVGALTDY